MLIESSCFVLRKDVGNSEMKTGVPAELSAERCRLENKLRFSTVGAGVIQPLSLINALNTSPAYLGGNQWCKGNFNVTSQINGWSNIDEKLICYVNIEGKMKKMIKCGECDYTTNAPSHYFRHEIKHSKIKPFKCPICPQTFQRRYKIKYHIIKEHPGSDIENLFY